MESVEMMCTKDYFRHDQCDYKTEAKKLLSSWQIIQQKTEEAALPAQFWLVQFGQDIFDAMPCWSVSWVHLVSACLDEWCLTDFTDGCRESVLFMWQPPAGELEPELKHTSAEM